MPFHRRSAILALLGAALVGSTAAPAQHIYSLDLTSQAQVNAATSYTSADYLQIHGNDIVDLSPLAGLTTANWVSIDNNPLLQTLDGLGLTSVPTGLTVMDNPLITNLDALGTISGAVGELNINRNASLTNLDGLRGITRTSGLFFVGNPLLTELTALRDCSGPLGEFSISNNPLLTRLCGMHRMLTSGPWGFRWQIAGNAVNPTPNQIVAAGPCGSFALSAPSNCEYGRELALTGSPTLGGTITATMSGHDGAPFVTWGIGPPVTLTAMCSSCKSLATLTTWQFTPTISTTIPVNPAFLGLPLAAQGIDLGGTAGQTCVAITPAKWSLTAVHVATIGA